MTDAAALIARVLAEPERDDLRLVYADAIQDHDDRVPCPKCTPNYKTENGGGLGWLLAGETGRWFHVPCTACGGDAKANGGILAPDDSNKGSGFVPAGNAARAEFIRKSIEAYRADATGGRSSPTSTTRGKTCSSSRG